MKITAAYQHITSTEQKIAQQSRLEIPARITAQQPNSEILPVPTDAATESTSSAEQNEDSQQFNALLTVGAVKRILEELTSGKLMSWIKGNDFEKIAAQQAHQQAQGAPELTPESAPAPASTVFEMSYRYQQVSANFTGAVELADGRAFSWSFDLQMQSEQFAMSVSQVSAPKDPLIVSFDQQPFRYTGETRSFDFFANGEQKQLATLSPSQYYLAIDRNQNQQIDHGAELFGPMTNHGYQELARLDDDGNGFIDANDQQWSHLALWQPGAALKSLAEMGVAAISTESASTSFGIYDGDKLQAHIARSGIFLRETGEVGLVQQVDLNV